MCAAPVIRTGGSPPVVSIATPISASGSATRLIGRRRMLSSPSSVNVPCWPASRPGSRRISVPALPTSIAPSGARSPRSPTPSITRVVSSGRSIGTPIARNASTVESVSAEEPNPSTRTRPSASEPSITLRWLTDLSPGTVSPPNSPPAGPTRSSAPSGIDR